MKEAKKINSQSTSFDSAEGFAKQLEQQVDFFKKYFGFKLDLAGIKIPVYQKGFSRLIIVPQELVEPKKLGSIKPKAQPQNWIYDTCAKHFKCWRYVSDLDVTILTHDRHPKNGTYAILTRDRQEADEENKNLPAQHFRELKIPTQTIIEGMLDELRYWDETKKHRDVKNITLYPGSCLDDGDAPDSRWHDGGFDIGWDKPGVVREDLRARCVIL